MTLPKDVTVTDNRLPIDVGIAEDLAATTNINIRLSKILLIDTAPVEFA